LVPAAQVLARPRIGHGSESRADPADAHQREYQHDGFGILPQ
jgi:hypothetical protein